MLPGYTLPYGIFEFALYGKLEARWLFRQEKATLKRLGKGKETLASL